MCKLFKITSPSGLNTYTFDQSIVNCLIDNYDNELNIKINSNDGLSIKLELIHNELVSEQYHEIVAENRLKVYKELVKTFGAYADSNTLNDIKKALYTGENFVLPKVKIFEPDQFRDIQYFINLVQDTALYQVVFDINS